MKRYSRKKNSTKIFIALTVVAAAVFVGSNFFLNHLNDAVIAKVNDQKIYKSEIEQKLRNVFDGQNLGGQNQEVKIPEIESLPKEVIDILAKEIYLDKELTKKAKKSAATKTKEIKAKIEDSKEKILRQTYLDFLIKQEITDQKVSDKYVELSNELAGKKEYAVSHIVTKTKEEAEAVLKELKSKKVAKFAEVAKKSSIDQDSAEKGGELGYILEDNMIKEIAEVVTAAKKDEIYGPVQTKFGWHLIKVSDVRESKALPFESVKDNIRDQLAQDKLNEINSEITKDAKVQILIPLKEAVATPEQKPEEIKTEEQPAAASEQKEEPKVEAAPETNAAPSSENKVEADANAAEVKTEDSEKSDEITEDKKVEKKSNAKAKKHKSKQKNHR